MTNQESDQTTDYKKANVMCDCGSRDTVYTGFGGYQQADASRGLDEIDVDQIGCLKCGKTFWY